MAHSTTTPAAATTPFDPPTTTTKRRKTANHQPSSPPSPTPLIPGLPDHIAQLCLSPLPPSLLYSVCHSWRQLIYTSSFPPFSSLYAVLSPSSSSAAENNLIPIQFSSFDPISSTWQPLPLPPADPPLRLLLRHPSFLSRDLPIQSICASDNLVILAATTHNFLPALPRPLVFSPALNSWSFGPPIATPRRWCAVGCSLDTVYVASGVGSQYTSDVARSVEKWKMAAGRCGVGRWEKMGMLKDGRLSREAIEAIGYRGKLYMVNVKGHSTKEGVVYNIENDTWEEMSEGMLAGWRGPAASMDEDVIYVVDELRGALMRYEPDRDGWDVVVEDERLKGAEQIAAGGGRVCVIGGGCDGIVVVDVVASPPRIWVVETPAGFRAVAVHILPRMNRCPKNNL